MAMDTTTVLKLLAGVQVFEEFGPGDLEDFRAQATGAFFEAGQDILAEGESGRYMHVILAGKVEVFRKGGGKPVALVKLGPGESFGEMSLLLPGDAGRTASVRALERTATLMIDREGLARIPAVATKLYRSIARALATRLKLATDIVVLQVQCGSEPPPAETIGFRKKSHKLRNVDS
jgi:CRP-like cAMP-binding protein